MRIHDVTIRSLAIVAGIAASASSFAADNVDITAKVTQDVTISADVKSTTAVQASTHVFLGAPVEDSRLATQRGGQDLIVNDQKLKATLTDNAASNLNTGNNIITEGSLAGANGLPMVIQNSGNNVIIQNTTILNLNMK